MNFNVYFDIKNKPELSKDFVADKNEKIYIFLIITVIKKREHNPVAKLE